VNNASEAVRDSIRSAVQTVASLAAPVCDLSNFGAPSMLAALLTALGVSGSDEQASGAERPVGEQEMSSIGTITEGLLAGEGRYTRSQVADQVGLPLDEVRRLWRSVGFAEVADDQRVFTSADVTVLKDVAELVNAGIVDFDATVVLARPFGQLLSRLAAVQTSLLSNVLGRRIAAGEVADDPQAPERMAEQAVRITRELLPVFERATLYVWRRHLAVEAGRALLPATDPVIKKDELAAVGFIDIDGFTRLSRALNTDELAAVLEQFETVVLDTALAHGGRVIKSLGDEVMFFAGDAASAAQIAVTAVDQIATDDRAPSVHAGLAWGPVLNRGGDMFGDVVNIASRVTSLADSGTIRVDQAMADALDGHPQFHVAQRQSTDVRGYRRLRSYRLSAIAQAG
jgi:adenylate cyclase